MRFALVVHPQNLEQLKKYYPLVRRVPAGLLAPFAPYLPPARIGMITMAQGAQGEVIACPLLPGHFNSLGEKYLGQKILYCLKKAESLGAQVVGLADSTALFWERGCLPAPPGKALITTGLRLRTQAIYRKARLTANALRISWAQAEIVLVGPAGMEGETWIEMLAKDAKGLTLLRPRLSKGQSLVGRIMYETGLAIKITVDGQKALSRADIVFLHEPEATIGLKEDWFKPGALICRISPGSYWHPGNDIPKSRKDLVWLDSVVLPVPPGTAWSGAVDLSWGLSPVLAETMLIAGEDLNEWFGPGREITIKQVAETARLAGKYGLWEPFPSKGVG